MSVVHDRDLFTKNGERPDNGRHISDVAVANSGANPERYEKTVLWATE